MSARQQHGFNFENYCFEYFNIQPCLEGNYIYKWDNTPVSIKLEKKGFDIEMASLSRNASIEEDFYLIVGFWEGTKDNIVEIKTLLIKGQEYHVLFNQKIVKDCLALINSITNAKSDDLKWKTERLKLSKEWKNTTLNLVRLRFKRDHKTQKRMQCAINNKDFYQYFLPKYQKELI